jgi:precorrin-3B synthase
VTGEAARGWCPSLHRPMPSGDGLLVRVKPPCATLRADQAIALAQAASRFGNGTIELTRRANLQVRGLSDATVGRFAGVIIDAGLGSADAGAEQRRNVIASPLAGDDPAVAPGTAELAGAAEIMLEQVELAGLPPKFGLVVDGGGVLPVRDAAGDLLVCLEAERALLAAEGMDCAAILPPDQVTSALRRIIGALLASGASRRMRDLDGRTMLAAAGLRASVPFVAGNVHIPIGWHAYQGGSHGAFGAGMAFGQLDSAILLRVADAAARHGDGTLRITPWRAFVIPGMSAQGAAAMRAAADGLVTDPADPILAISACTGMPRCARASVAARQDAAWLAASGVTLGRAVHISGCAKGCAHSGAAEFTLVGLDGRYGLVRDGRADATPVMRNLTLQQAARALAEGIA